MGAGRTFAIAAALVLLSCSGSGATPAAVPTPERSVPADVVETVHDRAAQAALRSSLVAAISYFIDYDTYEGLTPALIVEIEPSLDYVGAERLSTDPAVVSITVPHDKAGMVYAAAVRSESGTCFAIRDDRAEKDGTTYGVVGEGPSCTGKDALSASDDRWP